MLKTYSAVALLAFAGAAFAQATPGTPSSTPSVTPSQTPSITPSQTPAITPSQTPSASPAPVTPPSVGGLSRCENMIGADRDNCLRSERAGGGTTAAPSTTTAPAAIPAPSGTPPSGAAPR